MDKKTRDRRLDQIRVAFANNIRTLRTQKGWAQAELAERMGLHRHTIIRVESGVHQPLYSEACVMADLLGVSVAALRGDLGQVVE